MAEKRINQKTPQGPRSGRVVEKPKDFFGSLSRIRSYAAAISRKRAVPGLSAGEYDARASFPR